MCNRKSCFVDELYVACAKGMTNCIETRRDSFGRSSGYTYAKNGNTEQTVTTAYGTDGRISGAGFLHGGQENKRGNTLVARRSYRYDTLGRPTSRTLARQGATRNDAFTYNDRSKSPRRLVGGLDTPSQKKRYKVDGTIKKYVPNKNDVPH